MSEWSGGGKPIWTIAHRNPRANRVVRVADAEPMTWREAHDAADALVTARPELEVWIVTRKGESGLDPVDYPMDDGHVLNNGGRWVRMIEGSMPK